MPVGCPLLQSESMGGGRGWACIQPNPQAGETGEGTAKLAHQWKSPCPCPQKVGSAAEAWRPRLQGSSRSKRDFLLGGGARERRARRLFVPQAKKDVVAKRTLRPRGFGRRNRCCASAGKKVRDHHKCDDRELGAASRCWCARRDLNPYVEDTRTSNVPVCQFQHSRITNAGYYSTQRCKCQDRFFLGPKNYRKRPRKNRKMRLPSTVSGRRWAKAMRSGCHCTP